MPVLLIGNMTFDILLNYWIYNILSLTNTPIRICRARGTYAFLLFFTAILLLMSVFNFLTQFVTMHYFLVSKEYNKSNTFSFL